MLKKELIRDSYRLQTIPFLGVCKTMEGTLCHFPFNYDGVIYEKCTKVDSDVYWCATVSEYSFDDYDNYGTCDSNCPIESGNHC